MNLKIIKLQALACAVFGAMLAAEWGYGLYADQQLQQQLLIPKDNSPVISELPKFTATKFAATDFAEMVERPLFSESRKPAPEISPDQAKNEENNAQLEDWSLIGVYSQNNRLIALFSKKNEAKKYLKLSVGQQISGWVLKEIRPDRVLLQLSGQQTSVQLRKPRKDIAPLPIAKPAAPVVKPNRLPVPNKNNPAENSKDDS
jgi:type II secretory pathway component PulC